MTKFQFLIPLVLLVALLLVACEQQTASETPAISDDNKATASFAVRGMT